MVVDFEKKDKIFISVILLVHMVFFLLACRYTRIYMGDSFEYIYEALNLRDLFFFYSGNPALPITPEYMTLRQPLYPLFLMLVYFISVNNWIVLILQNLLSITNIYYARKIFLQLGHTKKQDWLLLLLIAAWPAQFINANTIAPDILLQSCTLLYFGNFIALRKDKNLKNALWMSLSLIAGFMVKPVLYPFVVIHIIILSVFFAKQKIKIQRPVVIALLPLIAVLLYSYWNYSRTDKFHFSANQAQNAIYYYHAYLGKKEGIESAGKFLQDEKSHIASLQKYKDRYDYANERGITLLHQHFIPYMVYHLSNSFRMLIEPGKAEIDLFTGALTYGRLYHKEKTGFYTALQNKSPGALQTYIRNNSSLTFVILIFLFNCLRLAGLILFFGNRKTDRFVRIFIFTLIVYFILVTGPIASTRYFLPVSLIAIGCSTIGFGSILQKRKPANQ